VSTRAYEQRTRADNAERTRHRILDAAYQRLSLLSAEPLSVDRVAQDAQVSRSTVYLLFGSRAGLFEALGVDLLERGGFQQILDAAGLPDAIDALGESIAGIVSMYTIHRDVLRGLHSMSAIDPDLVGGAILRMDEGRATGMTAIAQQLDADVLLRGDLGVTDAADILILLTSFDSFDLLHTTRKLGSDSIAATLADIARRTLLK